MNSFRAETKTFELNEGGVALRAEGETIDLLGSCRGAIMTDFCYLRP